MMVATATAKTGILVRGWTYCCLLISMIVVRSRKEVKMVTKISVHLTQYRPPWQPPIPCKRPDHPRAGRDDTDRR
jgi:hypothetical protein